MAGFDNETVYGRNINLSNLPGIDGVNPTMVEDGQLLIASTTAPNIRVSKITSSNGSILVTNGPGTINITAGSTTAITFSGNSGTAEAVNNTLKILGNGVQGVVTSALTDTITISVGDATNVTKGVAKFNSDSFTVAGGMVSLTDDTGFTWSVVTAAVDSPAVNTGVFYNNAVSVVATMPTTAAVGDRFQFVAQGANGFTIGFSAGQSCQVGDVVTTTETGTIVSTGIGDWIELVCDTANDSFFCNIKQGNVTTS